MADRPASEKKQTGPRYTIREVLAKQGGGRWYSPKAAPHAAQVWFRKAIGSVYGPFFFDAAAVLDQRCNYLEPLDGILPDELGSLLTSSLFAYSVEINGSASMGAGALEAATTKLRSYPIFDPRILSLADRRRLVELGHAVWDAEAPVDWLVAKEPGKHLQTLDDWLLARTAAKLPARRVYEDLASTCASRNAVADDKAKTTKKKSVQNLANVATGIANQVQAMFAAKRFPEDFLPEGKPTQPLTINRRRGLYIQLDQLLGEVAITVQTTGGEQLLQGEFKLSVAEALVRALLLGRESFEIPTDQRDADQATAAFLKSFDDLRRRIQVAIDESAFGTGYEQQLRSQVYARLGVHPLAGERTLPHQITLGS